MNKHTSKPENRLSNMFRHLTIEVAILKTKFDANVMDWNEYDSRVQRLEDQAKADLLAWHREEVERIIGEEEYGAFNRYQHIKRLARNELRVKQLKRLRASLEVER